MPVSLPLCDQYQGDRVSEEPASCEATAAVSHTSKAKRAGGPRPPAVLGAIAASEPVGTNSVQSLMCVAAS